MSNYGSIDTTISEIDVEYFERYNTLYFSAVNSEDSIV